MKNKKLAVILAMTMSLTALVGCSNKNEKPAEDVSSAPVAPVVTTVKSVESTSSSSNTVEAPVVEVESTSASN
ncbi:MAG: hypothetical protein SOZ89_00685 [Peptoniphilaceae bacterium]|nr:hypothetical protein [Peptoniphilaceae bacterium]MDD7383237.1 hypothetical protein [Peptoniphilaceae bacterium]MDY3737617.1 hypothetical protein [Peptoniphilaceae bacterium]